MCGLLAYLSTDADRVDDATVDDVRQRPALPAPPRPRRHRGLVGRPRRARLQPAVDHRRRGQPAAPPLRRRPLPDPVQRRDLQLRRAARGARRRRRGRCATHGDTETIVAGYHLWGEDVVTRLRGMFAFVIWDSRDRDGVRRPRPVRHQAAVHRAAGRRRPGLQLGEEGAARAAGRQQGGRRGRPGVPAALPDAAVRARAGDPAPRHPPDRERHQLHGGGRRAAHDAATSTRRSPPQPVPTGGEQELYDRIADALDESVRQAHARRRHRRLVPLQRHRLDRDRRAGQALQPRPADLHRRLRAGGDVRGRHRRRVGRRPSASSTSPW